MYYRKRALSASDFSGKFTKLANDAAKQAVIREIRAKPIPDERTLRILCMAVLFDTENLTVIDLDSRNRVEKILSVPLCPRHALEDTRYIKSILGTAVPHHRAIGIHIQDTSEAAMELYLDMIDHFRSVTDSRRTTYILCRGFDTHCVREISSGILIFS